MHAPDSTTMTPNHSQFQSFYQFW